MLVLTWASELVLAHAGAFGGAAEPRGGADSFTRLLPWYGVLLGAVIIGGALLMVLRNYLQRRDQGSESGGGVGFSLSDLREMRDRGEITEAEFDAARAKIIARTKGGGGAGG